MNLQTRILTDKITCIVADYNRLSEACDAAISAGCMDIDGPLHDAIWRSHSELLKHADSDGWLSWFIYENDCGKKKLTANFIGKSHKITTPAQLAKFIVKIQATQ